MPSSRAPTTRLRPRCSMPSQHRRGPCGHVDGAGGHRGAAPRYGSVRHLAGHQPCRRHQPPAVEATRKSSSPDRRRARGSARCSRRSCAGSSTARSRGNAAVTGRQAARNGRTARSSDEAGSRVADGRTGGRRCPDRRDALPVLRTAVRHRAGHAAPGARPVRRARRLPGQPRRPVRQGLDRRRAARPPGPAAPPRWSARSPGTASAAARGDLGRGARRGSPRRSAQPAAVRPGQRRRFGGGGLTNEKAYTLGKFVRVALRHAVDRLQRPVLHVVGGHRVDRALGVDRGLPFPLADLAAADAMLLVGATRPTPCRRPCSTSTPAASAAPGTSSSTRGARRPPRGAPAPAAAARHRPGAGQRPAAHRGPGGLVDEDYIAAPDHRLRRGARGGPSYWPDRVERMTGVPAADLREAVAAAGHGADGDDPHRPRRRAAQQRAPTPRRRTSTWPSPWVWRAGPAPATAPSPGRATARAAASTGRRPTSCRATAGSTTRRPRARRRRLGRRPGRAAPARASPPTRCSTRSAPTAASARCWCWLATSPSPRRTPGTSTDRLRRARPPGRLRLLPLRDRRAGRRRAAHGAVGRGGRHDDQPRGPGDPPQAGARAAARGAHRPRGAGGAGRPAGPRATSDDDPRDVFDELRRASAGGIADYAGITLRADRGRARASSGRARPRTTPARRGCSPSVPHRGRPGPVHPGRAPRAGREPDRELPVRADHRPQHAAVPERHPDPAGAGAEPWPRPSRAPRSTPTWPAGTASPTATWWSCAPGAAARCSGPGSPPASGRTPSSSPFHWGGPA